MRTFESVADLAAAAGEKVGQSDWGPSPRKRSICSPTQRVITSGSTSTRNGPLRVPLAPPSRTDS